ncbi:RNA polymerase sigma factor [Flagellimonas eckloniae]|uniref:RNA polymerase sigma factor n=1 Tax=Flagellimonas eckloniae TaxID=346185 RepID=A0A0Q1CDC0_9FLAO|nr:RNA polymerase sigma-70 factor [Allomuricauda eckloniae]KQC28692.1 hypothetical protein AAY42_01365 [Allomuricauda eckloniae]
MKKPLSNSNNTLLALKRGEKSAFKSIFDQYEKGLYSFIVSITKSGYVAEEILQEVFIKIWTNRKTLDCTRSFDSYIYTVARNHTYNYLRKVANQESLKQEVWRNLEHSNHQTENMILSVEYDVILSDILEGLPLQKRSVFILSKQQGKSNQEIADLLNISPKTVKNHLWETLRLIKKQLRPHLQTQ